MHNVKTILLIASMSMLFEKAFAQEKIKFENLSVVDGLSNPSVQHILQDSEGFLWFGTADGLNKYDGREFTVYRDESENPNSLKGNLILRIYEDSNGDVWIGSEQGLNKYNRDLDNFSVFQIDSSDTRQFYNGVIGIYEDSDNILWIGKGYHGLTYFDRDSLKYVQFKIDTMDNSTNLYALWSFMEDSNGELWYTKGNNFNSPSQLYKLNKNKTREYNIEELVELNERQKSFSQKIYKDPDDNIWFSTFNGFSVRYKPQNRTFDFYDLGDNIVLFSSAMDSEGTMWYATIGNGLIKYDIKSKAKLTFTPNITNDQSISSNNISGVLIDRTGIFWLGTTDKGINKFDPYREPFELYSITEGEGANKQFNIITALYESKYLSNALWVGTDKGLYIFDLENGSHELARKSLNIDIPDDLLITSVLEDKKNNLWIGSTNTGLLKFNISSEINKKFRADLKSPKTITNNHIRSIIEDADGNIWAATSEGLNKLSNEGESIERFKFLDTTYSSSVLELIYSLNNSENKIASLIKIKDEQDTSISFTVSNPMKTLIVSIGEIFEFEGDYRYDFGWLENADGDTIYIMDSLTSRHAGGSLKNRMHAALLNLEPGTYNLCYKSDDSHSYSGWNDSSPLNPEFWGIEIYPLDESGQELLSKNLDKIEVSNSISHPSLRSLYQDKNGDIWIGTNNNGFSVYTPRSNSFKHYYSSMNSVTGFTSGRVNAFLEDSNGLMWIATFGGLIKFDREDEKLKLFTSEDGIPTNYIMNIIKDNKSNIWFSSQKGLTQFQVDDNNDVNSFVNYDVKDGLQAYQFSSKAALNLSDGRLAFGGLKGFNIFYPGNINNIPPQIVITKLLISNESITPDKDNSPLEKSITQTENIDLAYNQNDLSFEFTALHFARPDKNQYAHKLEGFNSDWIYDNRAFATYTNLDPGEYVFRIKASNSDGVWNEGGTSIGISISPPWWATIWAYLSYVLIAGGLFFTFDRAQKRKIILKEREKQRIQSAELRAKAAEAEARAVQAENERKSKELEEARSLQLSMLPKTLPELPHLDIAVFMKTATEVGGDYYDFHVSLDGTLTAVIGDATGHGLNAGTIVTITKSLFNSHGADKDILFTFQEISRCLKEMKFKYLSMCLQIVKIKGNLLQISSAGMPPALLYRKDDKKIEELLLKGMPLGAPADFPYEVRNMELNSGDTILLMSDGFPELMNSEQKMLGYDNAKRKFMAVAEKRPEEIINFLKDEGSNYVNHADPNDDVTFVVIKAN